MAAPLTTSTFRLPMTDRRAWLRYGFALGAVAMAAAARGALDRYFAPTLSPFVLFYPAMMLAVWFGGFGPGLFSMVLSGAFAAYFFIFPSFSIAAATSSDMLSLLLFAFVSVAIWLLAESLRRALQLNSRNAVALLQSQRRISSILESVQGCFFSVDPRGRFIHLNKACLEYLQAGRREFLGKSLWDAFSQWKGTAFEEKLQEAMQQRRTSQFEFHDARRCRWYEVHFSPSSEGLSVHFFDISSRRSAEVRLRSLEELEKERLRSENEELERGVRARTLELAEANRDLKAEIKERRRLEKEALEIVQKEQQRFAAQLHDGLCQSLTGIMMMAKALAQKLEKKSLAETAELKSVAEWLGQSITQARDMARGLFPVEMESSSLMFSLRSLAVRTEQLYQVNCRFHCPEPILIGDNVVATHLFRIVQEALNNAMSHGGARNIQISMVRRGGRIYLEIRDDGRGFPSEGQIAKGIGLQLMRYRARMLDASLHFEEIPEGTRFTCALPFPLEKFHPESAQ